MISAFQATITGRVQGVTFRDFTQRAAVALGLFGEVSNAGNGSVKVYAEGEKENLDIFITDLQKGPTFAQVDAVEHTFVEPRGGYTTFSITHEQH